MEDNYFTILWWVLPLINMNGYRYTHVSPILNAPSPYPTGWCPRTPAFGALLHASDLHWHLFYTWWCTCFSAILSNHPTFAFSHWVQKSVLYICVSFVAWTRGKKSLSPCLSSRCSYSFLHFAHELKHRIIVQLLLYWASLVAGKESLCNVGDLGSFPGLGRSPGEGKGYPLQYSGLENSMDYVVQGVAKSRTRVSDFHFLLFWSFIILLIVPLTLQRCSFSLILSEIMLIDNSLALPSMKFSTSL